MVWIETESSIGIFLYWTIIEGQEMIFVILEAKSSPILKDVIYKFDFSYAQYFLGKMYSIQHTTVSYDN